MIIAGERKQHLRQKEYLKLMANIKINSMQKGTQRVGSEIWHMRSTWYNKRYSLKLAWLSQTDGFFVVIAVRMFPRLIVNHTQ